MATEGIWLDKLKALSGRREAALDQYGVSRNHDPEMLERRLRRISADEQAIWGMCDDLAVLVRNSLGPPKEVYHVAQRPCGYAFARGFRLVLEGQARAKHLKRCSICRWPSGADLRASA